MNCLKFRFHSILSPILLLCLAMPVSAQLGSITQLNSTNPGALTQGGNGGTNPPQGPQDPGGGGGGPPPAVCPNGVIEAGEQCDGANVPAVCHAASPSGVAICDPNCKCMPIAPPGVTIAHIDGEIFDETGTKPPEDPEVPETPKSEAEDFSEWGFSIARSGPCDEEHTKVTEPPIMFSCVEVTGYQGNSGGSFTAIPDKPWYVDVYDHFFGGDDRTEIQRARDDMNGDYFAGEPITELVVEFSGAGSGQRAISGLMDDGLTSQSVWNASVGLAVNYLSNKFLVFVGRTPPGRAIKKKIDDLLCIDKTKTSVPDAPEVPDGVAAPASPIGRDDILENPTLFGIPRGMTPYRITSLGDGKYEVSAINEFFKEIMDHLYPRFVRPNATHPRTCEGYIQLGLRNLFSQQGPSAKEGEQFINKIIDVANALNF